MNAKTRIFTALAFLILGRVAEGQQIPPAPNTPDLTCAQSPPTPSEQGDTVVSMPDADGFYSLFNGRNFTGWWHNCNTEQSPGGRSEGGAIFRVDSVRKAIYSNARNNQGGVVMTKRKFENYELIFDVWS